MFNVVLVADRGATASRVIRACHTLGASVVAVHSDVDASAAYLRYADEAVPLGGRTFEESYGDPRKLVEAARRSGADAVHPGAGRLARDPAVARAVEDAGLVWLGLPSAVLGRMDVLELAAQAGLPPALPSDPVRALLTVTVMSGAGVVRQGWVAPPLSSARPLVEQAPAPGVDAVGQQQVLHAARALVSALDAGAVASVGVVLDRQGQPRFSELLPPSDPGSGAAGAILGCDLDQAQLLLASGGAPATSPDVGAALALAVRARASFAGRLRRWRLPQTGGVAVFAGVAEGGHLTAGSDRLLAVLTSVGADAGQAQQRAAQALEELSVEGVPTTLPLLVQALAAAGRPASSPLVHPVAPRSRSA